MKRKGEFALFVMAVFVAITIVLAHSWFVGPSVDGKKLAVWLQSYDGDRSKWGVADKEVCKLGTNAIPYLLRLYANGEIPWERWEKSAIVWRNFTQTHEIRLDLRQREARLGFCALASNNINIAPILISRFENCGANSVKDRLAITSILGELGPAGSSANSFLLQQTKSTNDVIRTEAFWAVGQIHADPKNTIPVLIHGLRDRNSRIRGIACGALENFGGEAESAIPELVRLRGEEGVKAKTWPFAVEDRLAEAAATMALENISNALTR